MSTFNKKVSTVLSNVGKIRKNSENPHFRSSYADLNEVLDVVGTALDGSGLYVTQPAGKDTFGQYVETKLSDEEGNTLSSKVYFSGNEDNMQKIGAAITYARRFGLVSLFALESTDDDGETAVGRDAPFPFPTGRGTPFKATPKAAEKEAVPVLTSKESNRDIIQKSIQQYVKVIIDKKIKTREEIQGFLKEQHSVEKSADLNDVQAGSVLNYLKTLLGNGKANSMQA